MIHFISFSIKTITYDPFFGYYNIYGTKKWYPRYGDTILKYVTMRFLI